MLLLLHAKECVMAIAFKDLKVVVTSSTLVVSYRFKLKQALHCLEYMQHLMSIFSAGTCFLRQSKYSLLLYPILVLTLDMVLD